MRQQRLQARVAECRLSRGHASLEGPVVGLGLAAHPQQMRQLVRIRKRIFDRRHIGIDLDFVEKRSHEPKHAHARIKPAENQPLRAMPGPRLRQPETLRHRTIVFLDLKRKRLPVNRFHRHITLVEPGCISPQERLEPHIRRRPNRPRRLSRLPELRSLPNLHTPPHNRLNTCPRVDVAAEIIDPPPGVEPHHEPHQQCQQRHPPPPKPCQAQGDTRDRRHHQHLVKRKRYPPRQPRHRPRPSRIDVQGIEIRPLPVPHEKQHHPQSHRSGSEQDPLPLPRSPKRMMPPRMPPRMMHRTMPRVMPAPGFYHIVQTILFPYNKKNDSSPLSLLLPKPPRKALNLNLFIYGDNAIQI